MFIQQLITLPGYLALKELWRSRGRFLLVSLVIALITVLVLFIAALGEGLGNGNREFISKLNGELIVFQQKSDFVIGSSRLDRDRVGAMRRLPGVAEVGAAGLTNVALILPDKPAPLKVALIGVEPGKPGEPQVLQGRQLGTNLSREVLLDRNVVLRSNLKLGDTITIRSTQGTQDEFYQLQVVGVTDGQQYFLQPSIIVPFFTWDRIRPKSEAEINTASGVSNIIIVKLEDPLTAPQMKKTITDNVAGVEVATIPEAIEAAPGYTAQQVTLQTQAGFSLVIGALVIGGFFQIQVLQKIPQIGVLKAIGASNLTVAAAAVYQVTLVTIIGVLLGRLGTYLLSLGLPPIVPIVFSGPSTLLAVMALMVIGPLGGLVSVRYAVRIEPLRALGLTG